MNKVTLINDKDYKMSHNNRVNVTNEQKLLGNARVLIIKNLALPIIRVVSAIPN